MPIYEYHCLKCGEDFEELLSSSSDPENMSCRSCGSRRVRRLLSAFAVGGNGANAAAEPGPCGACGAPRRGMCQS